MILALALLALLAVFTVWVQTSETTESRHEAEWEQALGDEESAVGRMLLSMGRTLSRLPVVQREASSPQWRTLQRKLLAAGTFGSSLEIFLAAQAAAVVAGTAIIAVTSLVAANLEGSGPLVAAGVLGGVAIAAYPWNSLAKAAKRRQAAVDAELPDFAELLQMPLSAGMSVLSAMAFTAQHLGGTVSDEVTSLLEYINIHHAEEVEAFQTAGMRLGTSEAQAFFSFLLQAHLEGVKLVEQLGLYANSLRTAAYQRQRANIKRLPIKLVFVFAFHLLPLLFILLLLPTLVSLTAL